MSFVLRHPCFSSLRCTVSRNWQPRDQIVFSSSGKQQPLSLGRSHIRRRSVSRSGRASAARATAATSSQSTKKLGKIIPTTSTPANSLTILPSFWNPATLQLPGGQTPLFQSSTLRLLLHRIPPFLASLGFLVVSCVATTLGGDDDKWFRYYPLPFALEVATGPSMMPTIYPHGGDLYLRDCLSHRLYLPGLFDGLRFWIMSWGFKGEENDGSNDRSNISDAGGEKYDFASWGRPYQKGDVITMRDTRTKSLKCKRIVGVAGDRVRAYGEFADRYVHEVDGGVPEDVRYEAPYCRRITRMESSLSIGNDCSQGQKLKGAEKTRKSGNENALSCTVVVPPDHVWVEGDNPLYSTDSRHYGPVPVASMRGRIVLRLWPLRRRCFGEGSSSSSYNSCIIGSNRPEPLEVEEMMSDRYGLREITEEEIQRARGGATHS